MSEIVQDGFCYFSIFDPATGATVAGTGMLTPSGPDTNTNYFETAQGRKRVLSRSRSLSIDVVDLENIFTIHNWRDNETPVQAVLIGKARNAQLYTSCLLDSVPINRGNKALAAERITLYTSNLSADWKQSVNLLLGTYTVGTGWVVLDGGTPDMPTGWTDETSGGLTFDDCTTANNLLTVSMDTPVGAAQGRLYLPIVTGAVVGPTLTFSCDFDTVAGGADSIKLFIEERDFSSVIGSSSTFTLTGTGRSSVSHTLADSDLYKLYVGVEWNYTDSYLNQITEFKWPVLRVDGVSEDTRY